MILSVSSWAIEAADAGLTGFGTFQVYPKDLRTLPRHPDPAVSWHSGFRGGAHARPKKTPVHHAARRRGGGMAARGARAATSEAADCRIHRLECFDLESMDCQFCAAIACTRLDRRPHHRDRVSLVGRTYPIAGMVGLLGSCRAGYAGWFPIENPARVWQCTERCAFGPGLGAFSWGPLGRGLRPVKQTAQP